jgi:hypothetical protein
VITGLYYYCRNGERSFPRVTAAEIPASLAANPVYRSLLTVYAADQESADILEGHGVPVHRVLVDAPAEIRRDAAHKMKHWMCFQALEEFGEYLWLDWDTVLLRELDDEFWDWCRDAGTPKFLGIPNYWATVNCGVYFCPGSWRDRLARSFASQVSEPNDELLWRTVLPADVVERPEFWWNGRVVNIWTEGEFDRIGPSTYLAHVRSLEWAAAVRRASATKMKDAPSHAHAVGFVR